jgi:hypothetical protein
MSGYDAWTFNYVIRMYLYTETALVITLPNYL